MGAYYGHLHKKHLPQRKDQSTVFTGIVQGKATLHKAVRREGLYTYEFEFPTDQSSTETGASVAINGTCLTAVRIDGTYIEFDLMTETLRLTNLGDLSEGDEVNFEHAARIGDEIGGHLMSGHIHDVAVLTHIERTENNVALDFQLPPGLRKYVFDKGFIGVNGASLTIGAVNKEGFRVNLIPETLRVTTFSALQPGDKVNIEVDPQTQTLVDSLERLLPRYLEKLTAGA
ncbi:riboflavin synthase, alpha subunit [Hahella chejuensis KCTC 2396]|uniref:Riboflavin synthase n=1 Tax=Hahella chejuensis (strain KCTC 2396) TaxID=349521 RepID=Q2SIR3_HAHCH|nr:riboflavin synthase subunit alpha [Hahella chejuensis]ABC29461.1 riboflavin synthase, alpha subunit [Hahella chejuensis KCTC 2396]